MKKGKIKYIIKKIFIILLIVLLSIFLYQIFIEIKRTSNKNEIYGTKISAEENNNEDKEDISSTIEKATSNVVGISKIKNTGSSAFLSQATENLGLGSGIIVSNHGYILTTLLKEAC